MYTNRIAGERTGRRQRNPRLAGLLFVVVLLCALVPARRAFSQGSPPVYTFGECEDVEEELLRGELNRIVKSVFDSERSNLDYEAIVDRNWNNAEMDEVVDSVVDKAADELLEEEGLWKRIKSGWHSPTAELFATRVITTAFESTEFGDAVDLLSARIVDELAVELQIMTTISASSALLCLQEFIGETFSDTMSDALERIVQERLEETNPKLEVPEEVSEVMKSRGFSLTGVSVLLGTQIAKILAQKISGQIIGKIVTRIIGKAATAAIPIAGWIIGGALIIWDIVQLPKGSIPKIRSSLKEEQVKELIRSQIANIVQEEVALELDNTVESVTVEMYQEWKAFLEDFERVLRLAEKNSQFREIVDGLTANQVKKLSELVAVCEEVLGAAGLNKIIDSGVFERIRALPKDSFEILQEKADPDLVLSWADLAGERIVAVVETKLYVYASPSDFVDLESLERVLALEEPAAIGEFLRLNQDERTSLLELPVERARWLLLVLTVEDVSWLARYMLKLKPPEATVLVDYLKDHRGLLNELKSSEELHRLLRISLGLAVEYPDFNELLLRVPPEQQAKLANLAALSKSAVEPEQLRAMIESGQLEQILALPSSAIGILRDEGDPALVIEWGNFAGEFLDQVVETGLYGYSLPSEIDGQEELRRILALEDAAVIQRLMEMDRVDRSPLLDLPPDRTRSVILHDILVAELPWLADYMQELPSPARRIFVNYLLNEPELVPLLKDSQEASASFARVIDLAFEIPEFQRFLFDTSAAEIEKLARLVIVAEQALSQEQVVGMIESGQFETIFALPQDAFEILREKKEPALVIRWADLAGESLVRAAEVGLFSVANPDEFQDTAELDAVLDLEEVEAMEAVMRLNQNDRSVILSLAPERARLLLTSLDVDRLSQLIESYLAHLSETERDLLAGHVLERPDLLSELELENIRDALLATENKESSLVFLAQIVENPVPWWPTAAMLTAFAAVASGGLAVALFSHYYVMPSLVLLFGVVVLAALAVLAAAYFRRSRKPAQQVT